MALISSLSVLAVVLGVSGAGAWEETDFPPRPVIAYPFNPSDDATQLNVVVGSPKLYTFQKGDTLHDVARHLGLGINEVQKAFPTVDVWLPPEGYTLPFPTYWILPDADHRGIVVNIPEMRLYYYPVKAKPPTVITYPVGLGRYEWQTPTGRFKVSEKTVNPTWVIPESIREEWIREKGRNDRVIPGGSPDNPLGRYRMRLTLPLYGIHGTNIAWGVGMQVSHGCIRLYPEDIDRLFPLVPVGTAGEIVYQPVKIGARQGEIMIEVHDDIYDVGFDYWAETRSMLKHRGWEDYVDWGEVATALETKSGVPTRISVYRMVPPVDGDGVTEAHAWPSGQPVF